MDRPGPVSAPPADSTVVQAVVNRKIQAKYHGEITECVREHIGPLLRFLFRFTRGDRELSKDLAQQVFIQAAVNWVELRMLDANELHKLLILIATRRAIDTFRRKHTERTYRLTMLPFFRQSETDPQMHAMNAAAIECFVKTVATLPRRQAQAATLKWRLGLKNREIADELGISPGAVSQLLTKAKVTLKRELRPYLPFDLANREEEPDHE